MDARAVVKGWWMRGKLMGLFVVENKVVRERTTPVPSLMEEGNSKGTAVPSGKRSVTERSNVTVRLPNQRGARVRLPSSIKEGPGVVPAHNLFIAKKKQVFL